MDDMTDKWHIYMKSDERVSYNGLSSANCEDLIVATKSNLTGRNFRIFCKLIFLVKYFVNQLHSIWNISTLLLVIVYVISVHKH